jgi:hypothetical protein
MNQGAKRHAIKDRGNDLYETPTCAIRALMRVEDLPHVIWEPCAGRGAISRELISAEHAVITSDLVAYQGADNGIQSGIDFLMERKPPTGCQTIVTNPPFKLADQCIQHGLNLGCTVIFLLRLMAIEGSGRSVLIDNHLRRIWAGIERLPGMHREGWAGARQSQSGAPFAWFIFEPMPVIGKPIELRRMSWRS